MCWVLPAPDVVSTIKEAPIGVERYDNDTNGSRAKDDRELFGRRVRPGASRYCDSVAGWNRWVIKWLERNKKGEMYQEPLKPLSCFPCLLTHHFLVLPIEFLGIEPPFVDIAGMVVIEPEAIVIRAESVAETDG